MSPSFFLFFACVAFIFMSVSLSAYCVSLSAYCVSFCLLKSVYVLVRVCKGFCVCLYVCARIRNSVSVDLPVGIPLPFNSYRGGMLKLPLP